MENKEKQRLTFAENLNRQLKINKKTQTDLANDLGFSTGMVSEWATAKKYPRMDKVQSIADYLGIYKSNLTEELSNQNKMGKGIKIPVLGCVIAGVPIEAVEEILGYEEIDEKLAKTGKFFGLKIKGNSMEPRIQENDVVIVKQQNHIETGQLAIVLVNGLEATVKQVKKMDSGIMLIPFNTNEYEPMFYDIDQIDKLPVTIIGRVVELRGKF